MKKYFVWRGAYRGEMIREHSKTDISVMWSGSVSGAVIPPWSSIRHMRLGDGWPTGDVCDCTPSGWFYGRIFTRWFVHAFLLAVQHLERKKVVRSSFLSPVCFGKPFTGAWMKRCYTSLRLQVEAT